MVLKYHISPAPTILEDLVVKVWEASNDGAGAEVYTQVIPEDSPGTGHSTPTTVTINGLDLVVHIVRLYTAVSVTLLHEYNAEPQVDTVQLFDPIRFKIGDGGPNTPAANTSTYTNVLLHGLLENEYIITRNNYGDLLPNIHYNLFPGTDQWQLMTPDVFGDLEEFTIVFMPKQITSSINDSVVGKWFNGFVDISSNTFYSSSHLRKLIRFHGTCSYTFQGTYNIPIGFMFCFNHHGGGGQGTVNFYNGDCFIGNTLNNAMTIPEFAEGGFVWDGTNWNIVYLCNGQWFLTSSGPGVGQVIQIGQINVGDLPGGDVVYRVFHGMNVSGDYHVFVSIKGNTSGNASHDNQIAVSWYHDSIDKPNYFNINVKEEHSETQNISFCYILVKA